MPAAKVVLRQQGSTSDAHAKSECEGLGCYLVCAEAADRTNAQLGKAIKNSNDAGGNGSDSGDGGGGAAGGGRANPDGVADLFKEPQQLLYGHRRAPGAEEPHGERQCATQHNTLSVSVKKNLSVSFFTQWLTIKVLNALDLSHVMSHCH